MKHRWLFKNILEAWRIFITFQLFKKCVAKFVRGQVSVLVGFYKYLVRNEIGYS